MVATDPLWAPSPIAYDQLELRTMDALMSMANSTAGGARAGVRPGDPGFVVSRSGSTINITGGVGCAWRSGQGLYRFQLAATSPGTLAAAHASFSRIDLVYVRVWDNSVDSSGLYKADTVLLTGTPSGSPVAPTPGATEIYVPLATVTVPSTAGGGTGSATISTSVRAFMVAPGGVLPVTAAADIAVAGLYAGQVRYNTVRGCPEYWSGSAWAAQGDWSTYTPTWGGALTVMGAAISTGRWTRIGNTVHMHAKLGWGTGSNLNPGNLTVTAPAASTAVLTNATVWTGTGFMWDGTNPFKLFAPVLTGGSSSVTMYAVRGSDNGYQSPQGLGYVWNTAGAHFTMNLTYEAA
ncbi:hypothetical protein [Streptomyces sp. NPDC096033]|uniref:hypothetical protein n=1 Tax=Streptomyces sp. NPDC096033 TaxID=3366071 RepID=UPI00381D7BAD